MTRKLEIGPGDCPLLGDWDRLDAFPIPSVPLNFVARLGYEPLPIADGSYDLVYCSHVIEHIPWYLTSEALQEIYRILASGGLLEIWTVDFYKVVQSYLKKQRVDDWDCGGRIKHWMQHIAGRIFAYEKDGSGYNWHKAIFDREYLRHCLHQAGFTAMLDLEKTRGHDHGVINLGVWARKS